MLRLTREITDWFFHTQDCSTINKPSQNGNTADGNNSTHEIFDIITLAVPRLIEEMFKIINQINVVTKEKNDIIPCILDGIKKPLTSIMQLYETRNIRRDNVIWKGIPPIETLISFAKNVFWSHILKVSNIESNWMDIHERGFALDDEAENIDFGILAET